MRSAVVLLMAIFAFPVLAEDAAVKRQLITQFVEVIDLKTMLQTFFDKLFDDMVARMPSDPKEREQLLAFRGRLYAHVDYDRFARAVYAPSLEQNFSIEELRELIAFAKTGPGKKFIHLMPGMGTNMMSEGTKVLQEAWIAASKDLAKP
jgi:hypothetical protein